MNLIRDLEGNEYPLQATITYDKELNGNQSISFRVLPSNVNTFIHDITEMWEVVADTDYKIIYCKKRGEGDKLSVEIKAIPVFFDAFDTQRIYEEYNEHMTAQLCFNRIFQNSGYNVVLNGTFEAIQWEGFGAGDTRLTLFKNALNRYKAEFTVSGNTVTIENLIGRDTQFMYRYKLNASNIVQENDATSYWTYAKGYGGFAEGDWQDANLIREYTSPIASIIGKREAPPIKNGNITTAETMDSQLKTLVDDSLKISVSADIHDLEKYPLAQPMVGDRAYLIDERIGLETEIRIQHLSITKDWKGNILNLQAQFGSPNIVKRHQSNLQTAIGNITNLLEGKIKLPFSVLDNAVAEATKALQSAQTELNFDNGILAINPNNPNEVVIFNSAGFGVSNDGGATFKTAMTGQGLVANIITSGSLFTNNVSIVGDTNYFYWDSTGIHAINPNDINKYVRLNSNGLYISRGAMTVERPDGFALINNGLANFDLNVHGGTPQYVDSTLYEDGTPVVKNEGPYTRTASTAYRRFDYFRFRHASRYISFAFYGKSGGDGAFSYVRLVNSEGVVITSRMTNNVSDTNIGITVDLGTPTGDEMIIYAEIRTTSTSQPCYIRLGTKYMTG